MSRLYLFAILCIAAILTPCTSIAADRPTDEQVKKLIEDIDNGFDKWKDGLEKRNLDDAVIKSAERTIDVNKYLKDFEDDIDHLKDRFKPNYAASDEVLRVLRRGSDVELRNRRQDQAPSSEWTALGSKLSALAAAYGVGWPIESANVQPGRLNDGELASRLDQMEKSAKQLRNEADKAAKANQAIDQATRESIKGSIEELETTVKDVRSRVKSDRPASTEAGQLLSQASSVHGMLSHVSLSPDGKARPGTASRPAARRWRGRGVCRCPRGTAARSIAWGRTRRVALTG